MSHYSFEDIFDLFEKTNCYVPRIDKDYCSKFSGDSFGKAPERFALIYPSNVFNTDKLKTKGIPGVWCSAMKNDFFVGSNPKARLRVSREAYKGWIDGILEDESLLSATKKRLREIFTYSVCAEVDVKKTRQEDCPQILNKYKIGKHIEDDLYEDCEKRKREEIQKALKSELILQFTGGTDANGIEHKPSDPHFKGKTDDFLQLVEQSPMDALGVLCVLSLVESEGERIENVIAKTFQYFSFPEEKAECEYYKNLWELHCKGSSFENNPQRNTEKFHCKRRLDLIDYYAFPVIKNRENEETESDGAFFNFDRTRIKHVISSAGYGKTALMDMLLLCSVYEKCNIPKEQREKYRSIKQRFVGPSETDFLPIFISAYKINDLYKRNKFRRPFEDAFSFITSMADDGDNVVIKNALNKDRRILILVDAIDEVENVFIDDLMGYLHDVMNAFPNASIIQASRPLGMELPYVATEEWDLYALRDEDVHSIIHSVVPAEKEEILRNEFEKNANLFRLSHNPLMLFVIIDEYLNKTPCFTEIVESIIYSIIKVRFNRSPHGVNYNQLRWLYGYLAIDMIKKNGKDESIISIEEKEITDILINAPSDLRERNFIDDMGLDRLNRDRSLLCFILPVQAGLLVWDGDLDNKRYLFLDPLIMDSLAADYLKQVLFLNVAEKEGSEEVVRKLIYEEMRDGDNAIISGDIVTMLEFLKDKLKEKPYSSKGVGLYMDYLKEESVTQKHRKSRN